MPHALDLIRTSNRLASRQAHRQLRHLWIAFIGAMLIIPAYLVALYMAKEGWVTPLFPQTVLRCIIPYLVASHLLYKSLHIPVADQRTLLLINTLLPYVLMVLVFALLQQRYSRGAMLMVAMLTSFWFALGERVLQKKDSLRLICLDDLTLQELHQELGDQARSLLANIDITPWTAPEGPAPDCDGALVSKLHGVSTLQAQQLAMLKQAHVRIYSVASIAETLTGRKSQQELGNLLWQPDGNPAYDTFKRLMDVFTVIVTAPGWLTLGALTALAIRLDSAGPVLFSQVRTGLHGKPFRIWKFRTMVVQSSTEAQFAQANDKRITRIGHFLRKSRLDEIPQLVNVLLGHMSLIGPRPEQHSFVNGFAISIPSYPYRHLVRPGITGWAQVMQGYAASEEETAIKLSYDLYYVSHYSLALDLLIVVKTITTIFTGRGAR